MTTKLKYEHIEVGSKIRAWDFQPMEGRSDRYVEGTVRRHEMNEQGWFLIIRCTLDAAEGMQREGESVYVPMETDMDDTWKTDRVELLQTKEQAFNSRADAVIERNLEGTGFTYGYIGNCESWGDDRAWRITKPHPGRAGQPSDVVGPCYPTEHRYRLGVIAASIRAGHDVATASPKPEPKLEGFDSIDHLLSFLQDTLIPDLNESGSVGTAADFEDCITAINHYRSA